MKRIFLLCALIPFMLSSASIHIDDQTLDSSPPDDTMKLIFIHHSCGENWLSDDNGGLGEALGENNYFVSDTNYGWGPNGIGDITDIPDWLIWFRSEDTPTITEALYNESSNDWYGWQYYQRPMPDPGGENEIILFKSCYPNSDLYGNPDDPPGDETDWTVAGAKYVYNELLHYFNQHSDKLFIVITAPPNRTIDTAQNARAFNQWLVEEWLLPYSGTNVAVWDFHAILTHQDNHHRVFNREIEYINSYGDGTAAYDTLRDRHPTEKGNRKATEEFVPMLNIYVNRWLTGLPAHVFPFTENEISDISIATPVNNVKALIDNFDTDLHWETDIGDNAQITCRQTDQNYVSPDHALEISVDIPANDWAQCKYIFDTPKNFKEYGQFSFFFYQQESSLPFKIMAYSGDPNNPDIFAYEDIIKIEPSTDWTILGIPFSQLVSIASDDLTFDSTCVIGFAFIFEPEEDIKGSIIIDDFSVGFTRFEDTYPTQTTEQTTEGSEEQTLAIREQLCGSILFIPLSIAFVLWFKLKNH